MRLLHALLSSALLCTAAADIAATAAGPFADEVVTGALQPVLDKLYQVCSGWVSCAATAEGATQDMHLLLPPSRSWARCRSARAPSSCALLWLVWTALSRISGEGLTLLPLSCICMRAGLEEDCAGARVLTDTLMPVPPDPEVRRLVLSAVERHLAQLPAFPLSSKGAPCCMRCPRKGCSTRLLMALLPSCR